MFSCGLTRCVGEGFPQVSPRRSSESLPSPWAASSSRRERLTQGQVSRSPSESHQLLYDLPTGLEKRVCSESDSVVLDMIQGSSPVSCRGGRLGGSQRLHH